MSTATKSEIREALEAFETLEKTGARHEKEQILRDVCKNEVFKTLLRMSLGPDRYYIRPSEDIRGKTPKLKIVRAYKRFLTLTAQLNSRELSGNKAKKRVNIFLQSLYPIPRKWFTRVINKDLRIGVGEKTLGIVWGAEERSLGNDDRIVFHKNKCVLAEKLEDLQAKKKWKGIEFGEWGWISEPKLDGDRALLFWFPEDEELVVFTRGGKRWTHLEKCKTLRSRMRALHNKVAPCTGFGLTTPTMYDGEFIDRTGSWNKTASIIRSRVNFDEDKFRAQIKVILWDWCPLRFFNDGEFPFPLKERKFTLMKAAGLKKSTTKFTKIVPGFYVVGHKMIYNEDEMWADNRHKLNMGFEGSMLKNPNAHMIMKRTADVIKIKPRDSDTGTILECVSGKNKHARATSTDLAVVEKKMLKYGEVENDGYYLHCHCGVDQVERLAKALKKVVNDSNDRRISCHVSKNILSYRYSERLGYFVVKVDKTEEIIHVGGKMLHQAGKDQRMDFWQRREELIGIKVDFKYQSGRENVAKASFNTFERLREDL